MNNIIYAYKKIDEDMVVYVGQTINPEYRRAQHEKYDPFNPKNKEYNLPLSRGIRKYGADAYEFIVLEDQLSQDELDEREKYWIEYYNTYNDPDKYNLTPGGSTKDYKFVSFSDEIVDSAIHLIKNTTISFEEISQKTGISVVMLSEINHGTRRKRDNETYPLRELTRGQKINSKQLLEIKNLLESTTIPMTEIARQYNVSSATIRAINKGTRQNKKD